MKYQKYRICVLGSKGVGKTAYIQSKSIQHDNEYIFINPDPTRYQTKYTFTKTIGNNSLAKAIKIDVIDIPGISQEDHEKHNEELDKLLKPKIKHNEFDGFVVMFDVTKNSTFEDAKFFINMIKNINKPLIMIGNKVESSARTVWCRQISKFYANNNIKYYETSIKNKYEPRQDIINELIMMMIESSI